METVKPHPLHVAAKLEDGDAAVVELSRIEWELALQLRVPRSQVRRHMLRLVRDHAIDETDLVARWLAAYDVVMEYTQTHPH